MGNIYAHAICSAYETAAEKLEEILGEKKELFKRRKAPVYVGGSLMFYEEKPSTNLNMHFMTNVTICTKVIFFLPLIDKIKT